MRIPSTTLAVLVAVSAWSALAATSSGFIAVLADSRPDVRWDASSVAVGDFDGDGFPDSAAVGYKASGIVLATGIAEKGGSWKIQYADFAIGQAQDAICSAPAHLTVVRLSCETDGGKLPGCSESPRASGLSLDDGACDPIYLYWSHDEHRMNWWRN